MHPASDHPQRKHSSLAWRDVLKKATYLNEPLECIQILVCRRASLDIVYLT